MKNSMLAIVLFQLVIVSQISSQSVKEERNLDALIRNYDNLTNIDHILNLFSVGVIGAQWQKLHNKLRPECAHNMMEYLSGLEQKEIWAIKMDDATGHYSSGYLWGNNYWTGSMTLCRKIFREDDESFVLKNPTANTGLSYSDGAAAMIQIAHKNPPFLPRFGVLKVVLKEPTTTPNPRTIFIGVCLPTSCELDDVFALAKSASSRIDFKTVQIADVRIPGSDGYSFFTDTTFWIMLIVTLIVGGLCFFGTGYDIILRGERRKKIGIKNYSKDLNSDSSGLNCTTYDLTGGINGQKISNCVGIAVPNGLNNNNSAENLAVETAIIEEGDKIGFWGEILLSFSVITNFDAICDRNVGSDTISCIHGIRALSMAWIILGHTLIISFKYSDNMELRKVVEEQFLFQTITNGAFSVDTFFFISGFLVSFLYFRTNAKGKLAKLSKGVSELTAGSFHFGGLVLYRFARLTAPYMYALGIVELTMKYFSSNSVFEMPTNDHINCPKYFWRNGLYINTLFPVKDMCMLWSWYLANDTQFYIIGAIILIVAVRHFRIAAGALGFLMVSAWLTTGIIAYTNNHMPNTDDPLALFDKIYDKPWTRLGPYFIGMSVGWILFKTNCTIKFTKTQLVTGWSLSVAIFLYLLYGLYKTELTKVAAAAYSSLSHSAWALALAWMVIACSTGNGGFLNKFLSATCLYPFSRVTYCAYLVHPIIIRAYALNSDSPLHMSIDSMAIVFFGQTVASYLLSFVVSLGFEAPVCSLLKIFSKHANEVHFKFQGN